MLDDKCILSTELRPIYAQPALVTILANKSQLIIPSEVRLCLSPIVAVVVAVVFDVEAKGALPGLLVNM